MLSVDQNGTIVSVNNSVGKQESFILEKKNIDPDCNRYFLFSHDSAKILQDTLYTPKTSNLNRLEYEEL